MRVINNRCRHEVFRRSPYCAPLTHQGRLWPASNAAVSPNAQSIIGGRSTVDPSILTQLCGSTTESLYPPRARMMLANDMQLTGAPCFMSKSTEKAVPMWFGPAAMDRVAQNSSFNDPLAVAFKTLIMAAMLVALAVVVGKPYVQQYVTKKANPEIATAANSTSISSTARAAYSRASEVRCDLSQGAAWRRC